MRSALASYSLRRASSLEEALRLLAAAPGEWKPLAGATDLMVALGAGTLSQHQFVSIWGIPELRGITVAPESVTLGALTTFTDILRHPLLRAEFPLLCRAAADTGGVANQNRGTIGGNIANASPAADTPPVLLVYDAELELASVRGRRRVRYEQFHTGYKKMDLEPDELIAAIYLPRRSGWTAYYRKVGARRAQAISKVMLAGTLRIHDGRVADVRVALGSVAPRVFRAVGAEHALRGSVLGTSSIEAAAAALAAEIAPIDDIRSTAAYRGRVATNLLREFLQHASR